MWFTKKRNTERRGTEQFEPDVIVGCPETLVLHADGSHQCELELECGGDELLHEWWVACDDLRCGCAGDEHDLVLGWAEAA